MVRLTGIGGVSVKARDPERLGAWYADLLGVDPPPASTADPSWHQEPGGVDAQGPDSPAAP